MDSPSWLGRWQTGRGGVAGAGLVARTPAPRLVLEGPVEAGADQHPQNLQHVGRVLGGDEPVVAVLVEVPHRAAGLADEEALAFGLLGDHRHCLSDSHLSPPLLVCSQHNRNPYAYASIRVSVWGETRKNQPPTLTPATNSPAKSNVSAGQPI